jgi:hypothetical protein
VQHRDFALGAADGVVDQVQLDLELFALLDLGAVGFQQRVGFGDLGCGRRLSGLACSAPMGGGVGGHLRADGPKLGHDLAMHRTDLTAFDNDRLGHWQIVDSGLFNTKTFAAS